MRVHGVGCAGLAAAPAPLDMGNAGTAMRLMMGLLAPQRFDSTLIGDESLMRRPMERVAAPLRLMGAQIHTQRGPSAGADPRYAAAARHRLQPAGGERPGEVRDAAGRAGGRRTHPLTEPAPSRDHTERMLGAFGVKLQHEGRTVTLEGGQPLPATTVAVPADFSSAAFFLVAGCLAADRGAGLTQRRGQPDAHRPPRAAAAHGRRHPRAPARRARRPDAEPVADIEVRAQRRCRASRCPRRWCRSAIDEFPVFFIAAACASGETLVRGALELRVKESDRLAAMAAGLETLGVEHQLLPDGLWIRGRGGFGGGTIDSRGDHRIAMAFAVAALRARAPIEIARRRQRRHLFPGLRRSARAAGLPLEAL